MASALAPSPARRPSMRDHADYDVVIPDDLPRERMPDFLRYWYLGSPARRYIVRRRAAVAMAALPAGAGARALDCGCGAGFNLPLLARRGYAAVGVDICAPDFFAARRVAAANGVPARFVQADVSALPFAASAFVAVTAVEMFEHVFDADRPAAARELARVLAPGGRLVLTTPNYGSGVERGKRFLTRFPGLRRFFPYTHYPSAATPRDAYHPYRYHLPLPAARLRALLAAEGLADVRAANIIFVYKYAPDWSLPLWRLAERVAEKLPLVRGLACTTVMTARKPAAPINP